jgi:hypothetical protein
MKEWVSEWERDRARPKYQQMSKQMNCGLKWSSWLFMIHQNKNKKKFNDDWIHKKDIKSNMGELFMFSLALSLLCGWLVSRLGFYDRQKLNYIWH